MAESTLSLSIDDLKAHIGHYLGYGRGTAKGEGAWTTAQANTITDCLTAGLSQVYTPPPLTPGEPAHSWSFLRPFANLTLTNGSTSVTLPDNFGGFEGPIYIQDAQAIRSRWELEVTNEGRVQHLLAAHPTQTGAPRLAAESVQSGTTVTSSTRSVLLVWPKADKDYTLVATYKHLQDALTGALPYPPGGAEHAELFKASCLAAAELEQDDVRGPRWEAFLQRLAASIYADRKRKGLKLGYNGDRSDRVGDPRVRGTIWGGDAPGVTYNGNPL